MTEHFDDVAVRSFAKMMSEKMAASRAKGRNGWDDPNQCSVAYLQELLLKHMAKGDPVDVANICMMLRHYDAKTMPVATPAADSMIHAQVQLRHGSPWCGMTFMTLPRENEFVFWADCRFRVCQVQHRLHETERDHFVPHLILQEELSR